MFLQLRQWALPVCLLAVTLKLLSSIFGGSNPSVMYYSYSSYSTTKYNGDGKVETTRKEDFQSNIPGLGDKVNARQSGERYYLDSTEEDVGDYLEDEVDSFMLDKW
ncbi:hypothetical protein ACHAXT_012352 [Thalassiosira profunda]